MSGLPLDLINAQESDLPEPSPTASPLSSTPTPSTTSTISSTISDVVSLSVRTEEIQIYLFLCSLVLMVLLSIAICIAWKHNAQSIRLLDAFPSPPGTTPQPSKPTTSTDTRTQQQQAMKRITDPGGPKLKAT